MVFFSNLLVHNQPYVFYWNYSLNFVNFDLGLIWTFYDTISQMRNGMISCPYPVYWYYYLTAWYNNREY